MGDIEIPRDIRQYESKLIGPFTTRQTIFIVIAAGVSILLFNLLRGHASQDLLFGVCFFAASPAVLFGFYKPYGMTMERFIMTAFTSNILAPKNRLYKSENMLLISPIGEDADEKAKRMKTYKRNKHKKVDEELRPFK